MVGKNWLRDSMSDEMKERGLCTHCDRKVESLDHILFECTAVGQNLVWELTKNLWTKRCNFWPTPSLATVVAPRFISDPGAGVTIKSADRRLFTILTQESAYLIWKMRCERVIDRNNVNISHQEVLNRWKEVVNRRLRIEKQAVKAIYGRSTLNRDRVRHTWEGLLENENELPEDWTEATGVLVGIEADMPST